jgi:hypothetical protein
MSPLLAVALVLAAPAPAEEFGAARARTLAPYLDEQTCVVVRLDLTRADADALLQMVTDFGALDPDEVKELMPRFARWLAALRKVGGRELYYVYSFSDTNPFTLLPLADGADVKALTDLLDDKVTPGAPHREKIGAAVVAADEKTLARLRKLKPADRPELAKAFAAAGDTAVQVIVLPQPHLARLTDEQLPDLPKQLGGGSTKPLTEGVSWAALSLDAPPKLGLRLTVKSPNIDSAKALDGAAAKIVKAMAAQPEVLEALPGFEKIAALWAPTLEGDRLVLSLDDKQSRQVLGPVVRRVVETAARIQAGNNLKQLVLGSVNHADANGGALLAVASFDKAGKPLLSWRVHLLPYLDEEKLYKEFHLDEPWDSDHNKKLLAKMPQVFRGPSRKLNEQGKTVFLAPTGKMTAWPGGPTGLRYPASFTDGTSNTIFLVMADDANAVEWTKPGDLKIDFDKPHTGLGQRGGTFLIGLADGSVRTLKPTISKETLRAAFTPAGGEILGADW